MKTYFLFFLSAWFQTQTPGDAHLHKEMQIGPVPSGLYGAPLNDALRSEIEKALAALNYSHVEELLVREIERNPKSPELLTLLGGVFFLDGRYLNCAIAMKKAEAISPLNQRDRFTLAMSYIVMKQGDWARPELEKLAAADPGNALYRYWIARLDYDAGLYQEAVAGFQKALELDPGFVKAHDNLGLSYESLGNNDEAVRSYREAIRLNSLAGNGSAWPPLNLAILLAKMGELDEAEENLRESLKYDAKFAKARFQLGVVLEKRTKIHEAVRELKQAADLDPTYPEPHYALARIYRRLGEREKADKALESFLKLKNNSEKR